MELEIISGLSELGFRLARTLIKYFDFFSNIPYLKYVVLGFGSLIIFVKGHINPRSWKRANKKA